MKSNKFWTLPLATVLAVGMAASAQAQPAPGGGGGNNGGGDRPGGGGRPNWGNMTPEQRKEMQERMAKQREEELRTRLTNAGFPDKALQDAIVAYKADETKSEQAFGEQARKLAGAIRDKATADTEMGTLLADFKAAAAAEKERRKTALAALDAKINYSKNPRLEAYLTLTGVIGDEASLLGQGPGGGRGGFGGGRGGRGGGPGGGRGGNGGGNNANA